MSGKDSPAGNTTVTTEPWKAQQPYQLSGFGAAQNLLNNPNPYQQLGQGLLGNMANGSPLESATNSSLMSTLNGDYMPGSQNFTNQMNAIYNTVKPQVDSDFERGGRYGSGLAQVGMAQAMANAGAGLYNDERSRQMQAAEMMPTMNNVNLQNANAALEAGQVPWQNLQNYWGIVGGNKGGQTSTPYYTNQGAGALGGALAGAQLGSVVPGLGTGTGALLGAGVGLL